MFEGRASFGEERGTASQHYRRFAKAGVPGYVLDEPGEAAAPADPDDELSYLMVWYQDIRNRQLRGQHFEPVGLEAIGWYEHFLSKVGIEMTAFDWDMIFRLDAIWQDCVPKTPEQIRAEDRSKRATRH